MMCDKAKACKSIVITSDLRFGTCYVDGPAIARTVSTKADGAL